MCCILIQALPCCLFPLADNDGSRARVPLLVGASAGVLAELGASYSADEKKNAFVVKAIPYKSKVYLPGLPADSAVVWQPNPNSACVGVLMRRL